MLKNDTFKILASNRLYSYQEPRISKFKLGQIFWCISRKYPYIPQRRDIFPPTSLWKFLLSFVHFLNFFGLPESPLTGNSNPFSGRSMDIFWDCTFEDFFKLLKHKSQFSYSYQSSLKNGRIHRCPYG